MDNEAKLVEALRDALEEYNETEALRGPRGGKPTVSTMAGAGAHLRTQIERALLTYLEEA